MQVCWSKAIDFLKDPNLMITQICLAIHSKASQSHRLLGSILETEELVNNFLGTLTTRQWLFRYLVMVFGKAHDVMNAFDAYEDPQTTNPRMIKLAASLEEAMHDMGVIEEFVTKLRTMTNDLVTELQAGEQPLEDALRIVRLCIEGNKQAQMQLIDAPGFDNEWMLSIIEAVKRLDVITFDTGLREVQRRKQQVAVRSLLYLLS